MITEHHLKNVATRAAIRQQQSAEFEYTAARLFFQEGKLNLAAQVQQQAARTAKDAQDNLSLLVHLTF